ncbi:DUF4870 domain-containing protein [Nonlabens sp.]|uniref:DUF4870 domain-containing protein n=1 Tax=Nonlabens sp. TaxID=1888209 RepID=UPI003F69539B
MQPPHNNYGFKPWGMEVRQFCMLMHLSVFASFIFPFAGIAMPLIMWLTNKDQSEVIDQHGKEITNWIISSFIYFIVSFILTCFLIGYVLLFALIIISIIFPIIGAVRASEGRFYRYPLSIPFIR